VGCFPIGGAVCGALDLSGNVMEWLATPYQQSGQAGAAKDFTPSARVLLSYSEYGDQKSVLMCGSWFRSVAINWDGYWGFRIIRSLRSSE
jgi:formylglycine-generating enzyme required for sulfatase activity